jgi:hypothetical protein
MQGEESFSTMKLLFCLICILIAGCDFSGIQRGKYSVSSQKIATVFSGKGRSVTLFGTKNTEINKRPTYELLKLVVLDDAASKRDMLGEAEHIGIRSVIKVFEKSQVEWDRQADVVLIEKGKYDMSDGRIFLLQCHQGVILKTRQFSKEAEMLLSLAEE